ncbi:hypothetical protein PR048_019783 [Dryococelus australis]|uniref:Uncharacterized protein n=1 Tax=Dryococelus australis TaxID=614101 RepID=A0ABQ9H4J1_9NEOP|nr:hypothetical protein PR048_019783 [Dryococelus australis]
MPMEAPQPHHTTGILPTDVLTWVGRWKYSVRGYSQSVGGSHNTLLPSVCESPRVCDAQCVYCRYGNCGPLQASPMSTVLAAGRDAYLMKSGRIAYCLDIMVPQTRHHCDIMPPKIWHRGDIQPSQAWHHGDIPLEQARHHGDIQPSQAWNFSGVQPPDQPTSCELNLNSLPFLTILRGYGMVRSDSRHVKFCSTLEELCFQPKFNATVAERLARLPPTKANRTSSRVTGFSQVGIMVDNAVGRKVFSGISHFPRPSLSNGLPPIQDTIEGRIQSKPNGSIPHVSHKTKVRDTDQHAFSATSRMEKSVATPPQLVKATKITDTSPTMACIVMKFLLITMTRNPENMKTAARAWRIQCVRTRPCRLRALASMLSCDITMMAWAIKARDCKHISSHNSIAERSQRLPSQNLTTSQARARESSTERCQRLAVH